MSFLYLTIKYSFISIQLIKLVVVVCKVLKTLALTDYDEVAVRWNA